MALCRKIDAAVSSRRRCWWGLLWVLTVPGCALFTPEPPELAFHKAIDGELYRLSPWSLSGRIALSSAQDAWSADVTWNHRQDDETIKLSGPLGQGAVMIHLAGRSVTVTRSDGTVEASDQPEQFINQQLGMFVPVSSLRYWVLGVPEPERAAAELNDGFTQEGWLVAYQSLQAVGPWRLPRKMTVSNETVKLKLIVDQWTLNDGSTR